MTASFQAPEAGFEHQKTMPSAPAPDGLPSETQIAQSLAHLLPPVFKDKFICDRPLEVRPVEFHNPLKGTSQNRIVRCGSAQMVACRMICAFISICSVTLLILTSCR